MTLDLVAAMDRAATRVEAALDELLSLPAGPERRVFEAMRYASLGGGKRLRPFLVQESGALFEAPAETMLRVGAALEMVHCYSLVHDDLPCFDDAATRRNRPSVHRAFDERIALLAGDALIVLAFQNVARAYAGAPERLAGIVLALARAVGAPGGLVAGQAWECEATTPLEEYRRQKTGALFIAATVGGALSAGADPAPWRLLGERLGEAYQLADDVRDALGTDDELGKPAGRDAELGRPKALAELGVHGAVRHFERLIAEAAASIPACPGAKFLRELVDLEAQRLLPPSLLQRAA